MMTLRQNRRCRAGQTLSPTEIIGASFSWRHPLIRCWVVLCSSSIRWLAFQSQCLVNNGLELAHCSSRGPQFPTRHRFPGGRRGPPNNNDAEWQLRPRIDADREKIQKVCSPAILVVIRYSMAYLPNTPNPSAASRTKAASSSAGAVELQHGQGKHSRHPMLVLRSGGREPASVLALKMPYPFQPRFRKLG